MFFWFTFLNLKYICWNSIQIVENLEKTNIVQNKNYPVCHHPKRATIFNFQYFPNLLHLFIAEVKLLFSQIINISCEGLNLDLSYYPEFTIVLGW